jgi:hypothetical protein
MRSTTRGKKRRRVVRKDDAAQLWQSDTANANANIHHRCAIVIGARLSPLAIAFLCRKFPICV